MSSLDLTRTECAALSTLAEALLGCARQDPALVARSPKPLPIVVEAGTIALSAGPVAEALSAA